MRALLLSALLLLGAIGAFAQGADNPIIPNVPGTYPVGSQPITGGSGGGGLGTVGDGFALVSKQCLGRSQCFDTFAEAIDKVEADLPSGARHVFVEPGGYTEDVDCDLNTGFTTITGITSIPGRESSIPTGTLARITGATPGAEDTLLMSRCGIQNLQVDRGPDVGDVAVRVKNENVAQVSVVDSVITGGTALMGNGDEMIRIEATQGLIFWFRTQHTCFSLFAGDANTSCMVWDDLDAGTASLAEGLIEHSSIGYGNLTAGPIGAANIKIVDVRKLAMIQSTMYCEGANVTCFEIDDDDVDLFVNSVEFSGGAGFDAHNMGQFINVLGSGSGSTVGIGDMTGLQSFQTASTWGNVTVSPQMECDEILSVVFDPVETAARFHSIPAGTANASEPAVDTYVIPRQMIAHGFRVDVNAAPSSGRSWTVTLRDDAASSGATCPISGGATSCVDTSPQRQGAPMAINSKLNLQVVPSGTAPVAASEMIVSFCLSGVPG